MIKLVSNYLPSYINRDYLKPEQESLNTPKWTHLSVSNNGLQIKDQNK